MKSYAALGEILLRLSPPGRERLLQSPRLAASFGGAEANVAVSLARFGHPVRFISLVPDNPLGESAVAELRKHGLDTAFVKRGGRRLGIYFAEAGSDQRPSRVTYDRSHSALAEARTGEFDWDRVLTGVDAFHLTGITPALSTTAAELCGEALRAARSRGLSVSLDLNFRAKLWGYGRTAPEVMPGLVEQADLVLANEEDIQKSLGLGEPGSADSGADRASDLRWYQDLATELRARFPNVSRVAITLRRSVSAEHNLWSAVLATERSFIVSKTYELTNIVDRIGSGDAFAAGLLHGLEAWPTEEAALEFAVAASCLKHSIPGDFNLVSEEEVLRLAEGGSGGRIER
jgi:2-dehydro-3-deoxygluconokinase